MHQIDVLISSKQKEWENKLQILRTQLQHRERDLSSLRVTVQEREAQVATASGPTSVNSTVYTSSTYVSMFC